MAETHEADANAPGNAGNPVDAQTPPATMPGAGESPIIQQLRELGGHLVDPDVAVAIFESLPDAIVVVNDAGAIQLVNRQAELLFGYHRSEMFDQPVEMLLPGELRDRHVQHRMRYLTAPTTRPMGLRDMRLRARHKGGAEFRCEINLSPIVTTHGLFVVAAVRRAPDESHGAR